jgi:hypothetical protein
MILDLAVTSLLSLIWCFVLVHISPFISDWNSLLFTGISLLYKFVTVQFVVLAVTIGLPLYFQLQAWLVDSYHYQDQHGKITMERCQLYVSLIKFEMSVCSMFTFHLCAEIVNGS